MLPRIPLGSTASRSKQGRSDMKTMKTLGLTALMALLAMAFGTAPAMAESTGLCAEDANPCESLVTQVHETGKAKLLSSAINVECDVLFSGTVAEEGSPLVIHGNFSYSNCKEEGSSTTCTATEVSSSASLNVLRNGIEKAEVTGTSEVLVECAGFIHCVYNGTGLKGAAEGSLGAGTTTISKQTVNKVRGFLCPKTATLDITTTPLVSTYIMGQMLCVGLTRGLYFEDEGLYKCKRSSDDTGHGNFELIND
jgi:hypothetical protein